MTLSNDALASLNQSALKATYDSQNGTLSTPIAPNLTLRR